MDKQFLKDALSWGFLLWLLGYLLGMALFMVVPPVLIGWFITPIATVITYWVLVKKIRSLSVVYYLLLGIFWTLIAVVFDYIFIVKLLKPADGYYKTDVYLYYLLCLFLPLVVGIKKKLSSEP